jgi:membrane protease YdiL (CAAX protease family)
VPADSWKLEPGSWYSFSVPAEPSPISYLDEPGSGPPEPPAAAIGAPRRTLPIERIGAFIEVVLCSGLPTQVLILGVLMGLGMQPRTGDGGWSPPFMIAMALLDMVVVLTLVCLFLKAHREPLRGFVVGPRRPLKEVLLGLALVPAAFALVVFVLAAILAIKPELHNVPVNPFERMLQTPADAAVFAFVAMFAGGVREETQRAFIIRRFDQYLGGGVIGILIYSTVFGLGHIDQGYAAVIATGVLGAAWGWLYLKRQSIIAPVVSHAGFNLAQLLKYVTLAS